VPRVPDPRQLLSGTWDVYHPRTVNAQLRAEYALTTTWRLSAEVSRSHSDRTRLQDRIDIGNDIETGTGANTVAYINNKYTTDFYKIEALGKLKLLGMPHELTLGASHTRKNAESFTLTNIQPTGQTQNIYNPVLLAAPVVPNVPVVYSPFISENTGVYFYDTVEIAGKWKLLAGMRETDSRFAASTGVTNGKTPSPALGVLYDIASSTTVYASYMKSLEEGPTAPTNAQTVNPGEILPPGISRQTEIGIRTSWLKGMSVNVAVFQIERPKGDTDPGSGIFMYNGTIGFRGIETTLRAEIDRRWSVNFSGQAMRAVQHSPRPDTDGKTPENTPTVVANASVKYQVPQVRGVSLNVGASFVGRRYINNLQQGAIPGVTLFNAGLGYAAKIDGRSMNFQVSLDNIANKRYWNSVTTGTYGAGMDRAIKFSAKIDF
jgi:iron complex outermembrane receptor protein